MKKLILLTTLLTIMITANSGQPAQPLLICLSFDDNYHPGGMEWAVKLLAGRKNADGSPVHASFMVNTAPLADPNWHPRDSWLKALAGGHELGNHTHDHNMGVDATKMSEAQWRKTIKQCDDILTAPVAKGGLGIKKVSGFRAPRGETSEVALKIINEMGYAYDSSVAGAWSAQGAWPEKLAGTEMWELPISYLEPVPEALNLARKAAVLLGFKQFALGVDMSIFDASQGNMTKEHAIATLKRNIDLRLKGERVPFVFVGHTHIMVDAADAEMKCNTSAKDRREFYAAFLDYATSLPEVRVVSNKGLVDWLNANEVPR